MVWYFFVTVAVLIGGTAPAFAQECLHAQMETADDRVRREQAIQYARRLNAAQHSTLPGQQGQRYRAPDDLRNLPPVPPGFQLQFNTDGRTYTFSLKDARDPCRFAVFSDQGGDVYTGSPQRPGATIIPLETR
jgi:hypothetical protein